MGTIRLLRPSKSSRGEAWHVCAYCGNKYRKVDLTFDSGSAEPTVGETLTGADSGCTGVVVETVLYSGTYAGGDAKGVVELSSPTGLYSDNLKCFEDDEAINGSTGGNDMMTADGDGIVKKYGQFYPESQMKEREGKWYCLPHYTWYWTSKDRDDYEVDISEDDRGSMF